MKKSALVNRIFTVLLAGLSPALACAQGFPVRPVTVIVPLPPGSSSSAAMQRLAGKVSETLGQPLVVENRPGANSIVGFTAARQAKADGHTLLLANVGPLAINPWLYARLPYDPVKDFRPITLLWSFPSVLFVPGSSSVRSVGELLASLRGKSVSYGSQGIGSGGHLLGELLRKHTGAELVHVPYKGSAPVLVDTIAGRVDFVFDGISVDKAQMVRDGRLRAIAIADARRSSMLPGVPTTAEQGLQGFELAVWFGVLAPAGVPSNIVSRLNRELVGALRSPDLAPVLQGFDVAGSTPEAFAALIKEELDRLGPIVRNSGAREE